MTADSYWNDFETYNDEPEMPLGKAIVTLSIAYAERTIFCLVGQAIIDNLIEARGFIEWDEFVDEVTWAAPVNTWYEWNDYLQQEAQK